MNERTVAFLKLIPVIMRRYEERRMGKTELVRSLEDVKRLLMPCFVGATVEKVYILCVREDGTYLDVRKVSEGSLQSADISLRRMVEHIVGLCAAGVYLAHNHTSMLAFPSSQDWLSTDIVERYLSNIGVTLHDHLIFVDGDMVSLKQSEYRGKRPFACL